MAVAVKCETCQGYEYVEVEGQHIKEPCPDCGPELVVCPIHQQLVMTRGGRIVGKCWGCSHECAQAMQWLRAHPRRLPVLA